MEPMIPGDPRDELSDLALELVSKASALAGQVHGQVREGIGDLVRSMNCYYSNLIEGHNTHPRDIEQALSDNYSQNTARRALQLEARAHIDLQRIAKNNRQGRRPGRCTHLSGIYPMVAPGVLQSASGRAVMGRKSRHRREDSRDAG